MNTRSKKAMENNVALDKVTNWKIRLAFLTTANSSTLGFTSNQLTEDAWFLGSSPIYSVRKMTKIAYAL